LERARASRDWKAYQLARDLGDSLSDALCDEIFNE